ncbi:uncharacterized protein AB675_11236 [Cyphellophora attinorum]|uniref:Uncharacterized protein n=1 Tax=Cyphellophora attinorum TaxID=1664694 RepID=A0A0N0NMA6_9EURO|nr:uncharacterized protein AB675_11236 [Phialophora attinorum]KPI40128.1 hypothetical protein AB675_11236 [Phialophora attinorum]
MARQNIATAAPPLDDQADRTVKSQRKRRQKELKPARSDGDEGIWSIFVIFLYIGIPVIPALLYHVSLQIGVNNLQQVADKLFEIWAMIFIGFPLGLGVACLTAMILAIIGLLLAKGVVIQYGYLMEIVRDVRALEDSPLPVYATMSRAPGP